MNTDDLRLLEDAADHFAAAHARAADTFDAAPDHWQALADLGAPGASVAADRGGYGFGAGGALVLGRALGAQAVPVDLAVGAILIPELLAEAGLAGDLASLQSGDLRIGLAADMLPAAPGTGQSGLILGPPGAVRVLHLHPETGAVLLSDVQPAPVTLADGTPAARGAPATARLAPGRALAMGLIAAAGGNLGAMERLFAMTLEHLQLRRQFGTALASFQSLQFRMVDLSIAIEESRALLSAAAGALDAGQPDGPARAHAAWICATTAGRKMAEEAIQLHGAIGMTAEAATAPLVRAILQRELIWGDADCHLPLFRAAGPVASRLAA